MERTALRISKKLNVDQEWALLILKAHHMGLTIQEVRSFLKSQAMLFLPEHEQDTDRAVSP